MRILTLKVWRDIRAHKWQFLALTLIILLGVTSYGGMMGMIDDVIQSIDHTLDELHFNDLAIAFESPVPQSTVQSVASLSNVAAVTGRLVMDTGLLIDDDIQVHARLIGMPSDEQPAVNQLYIQAGRYLQPGDGRVAVLDHHLAEHYGYEPGTVLHPLLNGQPLDLEVIGIAVSPEYLMAVPSKENPLPSPGGFAVLFLPEATMEQFLDADGAINELTLRLVDASPEQIEATVQQVEEITGGAAVRSAVQGVDNPSYNLLMLDLEGGQEMMGMVPSMFLVIAALSIYVFLNRMVQAQRPQIGVIKALGYGKAAVMSHYLLFSAIVGVLGSMVGFALSYPLGAAFGQAYAAEFGLPFVVTHFHLAAAAQAIAINLAVCLLAGLFPAWRSARLAPAQAIRFDPSVALVTGSVPLAERLLSSLVRLSTGTKIALRNLFRNRRRTLTTALGFVFAFVVLLACWSLFDGLGYMLRVQFEQTDRWDLHAVFSRPQPQALVGQIRTWPGVQIVEPVIELPATVKSSTATEDTYLMALQPDSELHHFQLPKKKSPEDVLGPGQALLTTGLGDTLGVVTGDEITLETAFGTRQVTVDTSNREVMSGGVYVSLDWLQKQAGGVDVISGLLLRVDTSHQEEVRKALYRLPGMASVALKDDIVSGWKALMGLYYVMMGMFLLFALIIAGAVIFNTMTVNVLERQREIATMRALGQNRRGLRTMITLENMLIGLLALVPGLAAGVLITYYLFQVFSATADFYMPFYIAPLTYVIVTVLVFGTALLSQIPAVRRVDRMNLAEATKITT